MRGVRLQQRRQQRYEETDETTQSSEWDTETPRERDQLRIGDGGWAVAVTLVLLGFGLASGSQLLIVAATVPLLLVVVAGLGNSPDTEMTVGRRMVFSEQRNTGDGSVQFDTLDETTSTQISGGPGDRVTVQVGIRNDGSEPLVDLRVADGVPDGIPVVSGTPTVSLTLAPGEERTFEYEVELRRGKHDFGDVTLRARNISDTAAETLERPVFGDASVTCIPTVRDAPTNHGSNDYAGEVATDEGGHGLEFYSVRDYEPGDPVRSIDWRRYANTRELATVEYRAERSTRIVCIVDVRVTQHRAQSDEHLSAVELSTAAAERTFEALVDAGHPTGVVALDNPWLTTVSPGTDAETRTNALNMLDAIRDANDMGHEYGTQHVGQTTKELTHVLPGEAQVFLFSSFIDDLPEEVVDLLRMHGYSVYVVSPDMTGEREDLAARLKGLERKTRLSRVRERGATVLDWDTSQSVGFVLAEAVREVSTQ